MPLRTPSRYVPGHGFVNPAVGPQHYRTFKISAPIKSHWRKATCEEYECDGYVHGFVTTVDVSTDLGQRQYHYLTHDRSRRYSLQHVGESLYKFVYGPGFRCFSMADHRVPIGRPPMLLVAEGDWRGNPRQIPTRVHSRVEDWVDHYQTQADRVRTLRQRRG